MVIFVIFLSCGLVRVICGIDGVSCRLVRMIRDLWSRYPICETVASYCEFLLRWLDIWKW